MYCATLYCTLHTLQYTNFTNVCLVLYFIREYVLVYCKFIYYFCTIGYFSACILVSFPVI